MPKKILLAEDEDVLAEMVKLRLQTVGYEVDIASDGLAALKKIGESLPDLLILDVMLPKMDGYKLASVLKHDKNYQHLPIIMFTARVQDTDVKTAYDLGVSAIVHKPFEPEVLLAKIKEILEK